MITSRSIPTIPDLLRRNAENHGKRVAFSSPGRIVTHRDLHTRTGYIASHLQDAGIRGGHHVVVLLDRCVEAVESILAIVRAGAIAVPIEPRCSRAELTAILDDISHEPRWIITNSAGADQVRSIHGDQRTTIWKIDDTHHEPNALPFEELALHEDRLKPPDDLECSDEAFLHYTSGTTGSRPKGVVSSQEAWIRSTMLSMSTDLKAQYNDAILCPLPVTHAYGFSSGVMVTLVTGASTHLTGSESLAQSLRERSYTIILGVPTTYSELVSLEGVGQSLASVRMCISGGAPASSALSCKIEEKFGVPILNHYGCTETCGAVTVCKLQEAFIESSSGWLIPGREIRIMHSTDEVDVVDGTEGEIWIRSLSLFLRYHNDSTSPFTDDWYRSGDLGRWDTKRNLIITGRLKELIVRGGQNIHPAEIEHVLNACEGVKECVVLAAPHDVFGEVPVAYVVFDDKPVAVSTMLTACREGLPSHKVPVDFFGIDAVPRTKVGKPRRRAAAGCSKRRLIATALTTPVIEATILAEFAHAHGQPTDTFLDPKARFEDMGMHSLLAIVIRDRLASLTGLDLPITLLFEHETPRSLSESICAPLAGPKPTPKGASSDPDQPASSSPEDSIVVISMTCQYPGGINSPEDLWNILKDGIDVTSDFPLNRGWDIDTLYSTDPDTLGTTTTRRGGFLHDMADFDAGLFGMSPREAESTDPQQRLLLESTWNLFERGGIAPFSLRGSDTGVYVGMMYNDYSNRFINVKHEHEAQLALGSAASVAVGRISHTFDLHGPALAIDTACSSSLVAIDLATKSLRTGECSLAIAGGVTLMATPQPFVMFSKQRGLSPDGRCRSYSDDANGTAWSEGIGLLLLERLSDARRNGHHILGDVRGSATNSDGRSSTLTSPNGSQQEQVIRAALWNANLAPAEVDVIEGHGTATPLGDPIEVRSLIATYGHGRSTPALLGSLKSNLGHTQAAAGVAGVIKMVMAMQKGVVPPSIHVSKPSRHIDWSSANVELVTKTRSWPQDTRLRRASVSAFGIGGTNACVILQQVADQENDSNGLVNGIPSKTVETLPWLLSAASEPALQAQAHALQGHLDLDPIDVAYSLATTRSHLRWRAAVSPGDSDALGALANGSFHSRLLKSSPTPPRLVMLFSGQGGQFPKMFEGLSTTFPIFKDHLQTTCTVIDTHLDQPLLETLRDRPDLADRTDIAQVAVFAFHVALYRTLERFGIAPATLVGQSVGEIAAAHVAGILSLEDAAKMVAIRGRLMSSAPEGAMASINATEVDIQGYLDCLDDQSGAPVVAAVNSDNSVVISGSTMAVSAVENHFGTTGRRTKRLRISHACHSPSMDGILPAYIEALRTISYAEAKIPVISTVTGVIAEELDLRSTEYWAHQLRERVRFRDAIRSAGGLGGSIFLEVGPSASLSSHVQDAVPIGATVKSLVNAMTHLHIQGIDVKWEKVLRGCDAHKVDLPTYPFQRRRYWLDPPKGQFKQGTMNHPFLEHGEPSPSSGQLVFTGHISLREYRWLGDHVMVDRTIFPAAAFAELAIRAGKEIGLSLLDELTLLTPLDLSSDGNVRIQMVVEGSQRTPDRTFSIFSRPIAASFEQEWTNHASGTLRRAISDDHLKFVRSEWPTQGEVDISGTYDRLCDSGMAYGPAFRCVERLWHTPEGYVGRIRLPETSLSTGHIVHPVLLDAAIHMSVLARPSQSTAHLPFRLAGVRLWPSKERELRAVVGTIKNDELSVKVYDLSGRLIAEIQSISLRSKTKRAEDLFMLDWLPILPTVRRDQAGGKEHIIRVRSHSQSEEQAQHVHKAASRIHASIKDWKPTFGRRLVIVTERATTHDPDLTTAAVWGFVRSAQSEFGEAIVLIDVDGTKNSEDALQGAIGSGEIVLAIRDGKLLTPKLKRHNQQQTDEPMNFSGTVLITGGTGALGLVLARHLVDKYDVKNLLLVSRSGACTNSLALAELQAIGTNVMIKPCDVADYDQVKSLLDTTKPSITAVYHAAGIIDDGLVQSLTPERITKVLLPKVDAAWNLHHLLPKAKPFVLFSSAAGILGNPGQANYAAGNTFLDALANHRRQNGLHALSLAWGPWQNESGMAGKITEHGPLLPLSDEQGLGLLDTALQSRHSVLVPLRFRDQVTNVLTKSSNPPAAAPSKSNPWRHKLEASTASERFDQLRGLLRDEIAHVLGYDRLPDLPFSDIGIDSLSSIKTRNKIAGVVGVMLPSSVMFEVKDITSLTNLVLEKLNQQTREESITVEEESEDQVASKASHGVSVSIEDFQLSALCRQLCFSRHFTEALELITMASPILPTFSSSDAGMHLPPLRRLKAGSNPDLAIVCLPDFIPSLGTTGIFRQLIPCLDSDIEVYDLTYPTSVLPDSISTLTTTLAQSITVSIPNAPIVLVGYSVGGIVAHALVQALGKRAGGLVLLDTYPVTKGVPNWLAALPGKRILKAGAGFNDGALMTMGHYMRITQGYQVGTMLAPTLFLRARDPIPEMEGQEWEAKWPWAEDVVVVPGAHISLLREHAESTAREICRWARRFVRA